MSIDRIVLAFAGSVILLSLALAQLHSPNWQWLTAFVGANLLQSAFTGFCPLARALRALGTPPAPRFNSGPAGRGRAGIDLCQGSRSPLTL